MHVSQQGIDIIKQFEGLRLSSYLDAAGVWTIGYGHTAFVMPGQRITTEEAEALLRRDLADFDALVDVLVDVALSQAQFDALVSIAFNIGATAFRKSTLLRKLNAGNYRGAAEEFGRWIFAGGKTLEGLRRRRKAERELYESEDAPGGRPTDGSEPADPENNPPSQPDRQPDIAASADALRRDLEYWMDRAWLPLRDYRRQRAETAARALQRELGVLDDAVFGPKTRAAIARYLAEVAYLESQVVAVDSEHPPVLSYALAEGAGHD